MLVDEVDFIKSSELFHHNPSQNGLKYFMQDHSDTPHGDSAHTDIPFGDNPHVDHKPLQC